jgi:ribosome biogenesis GTPase
MLPAGDAPFDPDWDDSRICGSVMRIQADYVYVAVAGAIYECRMRGKLKKSQTGVLVGDRVGLDEVDTQARKATVAAVANRRNALSKPAIANVDQALVVMAAKDPAFQPLLLDRFLVLVAERQVQAVIIVNKIDRMDPTLWDDIQRTYAPYYPVLGISAKLGTGIDEVMPYLAGKTSVLCGASGVGKSSLLNAIQPGLQLSTGDISDWGRGTHTTRHVALHQFETGGTPGYVADTPGFSLTDLAHIAPPELGHYFPEFTPLLGRCRFTDCLHDAEPDCAVRDAWRESSRYATYLDILSELTTDKPLFFATRSTKDEGGTKVRTVAGGKRGTMLRLDTEARESNRRLTKQQMQQMQGGIEDESDESDEP